jgi:hypothetical protein
MLFAGTCPRVRYPRAAVLGELSVLVLACCLVSGPGGVQTSTLPQAPEKVLQLLVITMNCYLNSRYLVQWPFLHSLCHRCFALSNFCI